MAHPMTPGSALLFPIMEDDAYSLRDTNDYNADSFHGDLKDFDFDVGHLQDYQYPPNQNPTPPWSTRTSLNGTDDYSHKAAQAANLQQPSESEDRSRFAGAIERRFQHAHDHARRSATHQLFGEQSEQRQVEVMQDMLMEDYSNSYGDMMDNNPDGPYTSGASMTAAYQPTTTMPPADTTLLDLTPPDSHETTPEDDPDDAKPPVKRRNRRRKPPPTAEQLAVKREGFLRRNRQAASLCRDKKKGKEADLQEKHTFEAVRNNELREEYNQLVEEVRALGSAVAGCECGGEEVCGADSTTAHDGR